jgi:hypothetical protein
MYEFEDPKDEDDENNTGTLKLEAWAPRLFRLKLYFSDQKTHTLLITRNISCFPTKELE